MKRALTLKSSQCGFRLQNWVFMSKTSNWNLENCTRLFKDKYRKRKDTLWRQLRSFKASKPLPEAKNPHTQCKRHAYYTTQGPRLQFCSSHTCLMSELLFWMLFTYLVIARKVHATSSACCHAMQCMLKGDSDILLSITQDLLMFLFLFHCVLAGHQKISHSTFLERTVRKKGLWIYVAIRSWGRGIVIGSSIHNSW